MLNQSNINNFQNLNNNPINIAQKIKEQKNENINIQLNSKLNILKKNTFPDLEKQSVKKRLNLNFQKFKQSFSQNTKNLSPEKLYFLSVNKNSDFENKNKDQPYEGDFFSKLIMPKFEQFSNYILSKERNIYKEFIEETGNIKKNDLNKINILSRSKLDYVSNISHELRKIYENNPFNYIQENPEFDFNNNKMGIYCLLQQNGINNNNKIDEDKRNKYNKNKKKLKFNNKRCNEHQRRKDLKNKEKNIEITQKQLKSFNNIITSNSTIIQSGNSVLVSLDKNINNINSNKENKNKNYNNINLIKQKKSYLIEEESHLFEKYFNSFIPYFKELISNRRININDKIFKLRLNQR